MIAGLLSLRPLGADRAGGTAFVWCPCDDLQAGAEETPPALVLEAMVQCAGRALGGDGVHWMLAGVDGASVSPCACDGIVRLSVESVRRSARIVTVDATACAGGVRLGRARLLMARLSAE